MCDIGGVCDGCGGDFSHLTKAGMSEFCGRCYKEDMNKAKVIELTDHKKEWCSGWVICMACGIPHVAVYHVDNASQNKPIECHECGGMQCVETSVFLATIKQQAEKIEMLRGALNDLCADARDLSDHEIDWGAPRNRWDDMRASIVKASEILNGEG